MRTVAQTMPNDGVDFSQPPIGPSCPSVKAISSGQALHILGDGGLCVRLRHVYGFSRRYVHGLIWVGLGYGWSSDNHFTRKIPGPMSIKHFLRLIGGSMNVCRINWCMIDFPCSRDLWAKRASSEVWLDCTEEPWRTMGTLYKTVQYSKFSTLSLLEGSKYITKSYFCSSVQFL